MKGKFLLTVMLAAGCFSGMNAQEKIGDNPMVRENGPVIIVDTITTNINTPYIILSNYNSEEILIVVTDLVGNEIFSKVVFKNKEAVLKAYDPYNKIPAGVYTVTATNRNEIYNQRIVID
ncbi:MAG: hypothetical protein IT233_04550 [Bacteroidia bacterium]|nr:hypothetical protein [Bacteroidia bacterium]